MTESQQILAENYIDEMLVTIREIERQQEILAELKRQCQRETGMTAKEIKEELEMYK